MLFHLEEAGLRYIPQKNGFREVESTGPPRPRCAKMGLKRPKSQPSTTGPTTAVHVNASQATAPQTVVVSQQAPAGGAVTINNAIDTHPVHVCVPEQQQTVPVSNSVQGSVPMDAQAVLMPPKDEAHQAISESQNHTTYQSESSIDGTCGNENKTVPEAEMTIASAKKSSDGSIDTADSHLEREEVAMDTETQLSSKTVTEIKSYRSADTPVVPTGTAITGEHAIAEDQSVQSTVFATKEPGTSPHGQEMRHMTDQKDDLATSGEQIANIKPVSPKPSAEQQNDKSELLTDADSSSSVVETSHYTEVAKSGPPLENDSGTAQSNNDSTTAKAKADIYGINPVSNTAREGSNNVSLRSEEMAISSEKPEDKALDAKVEESSGEPLISGISETSKQQQQQQPSLVPYENEDSSSSNEATTAQNESQASTAESTSSSKDISEADEQGEVQRQKQDEGTNSDIVTEDKPGENSQSDETKADVDKGAINSESKDISRKNAEKETLPGETNASKNLENLQNVEAPRDETVQNVKSHEEESHDSNGKTQGSETIAGDAIKQQQQGETKESQSKMEGSEMKTADDVEDVNGQVAAERKVASPEQMTGDNSTNTAIFSVENQVPQVYAESMDSRKSQTAESRLSLPTGALAEQGKAQDSEVQKLTGEVDIEATPVVNNHLPEQVSYRYFSLGSSSTTNVFILSQDN